MFKNVLSFIKTLTLDFLIGDQTRSETTMFYFSKSTVPTVKRIIMQGGIIQIHDNRISWLTENVSKTKYGLKHVENCKKVLKCYPKSEKKFLRSAQKSRIAQECWKCTIVLQIRKSAQRNRDIIIIIYNIYRALIPNGQKALYIIKITTKS